MLTSAAAATTCCLRINELRVYGSPVRPASATAPPSLPSGKHTLTSAGRSPDDAFFLFVCLFLNKIPSQKNHPTPECLRWTVSYSREEEKNPQLCCVDDISGGTSGHVTRHFFFVCCYFSALKMDSSNKKNDNFAHLPLASVWMKVLATFSDFRAWQREIIPHSTMKPCDSLVLKM